MKDGKEELEINKEQLSKYQWRNKKSCAYNIG